MSVEEDIQELKDALAALRSENLGLKNRLSEVEDFAQTHVGLDWGTAGTANNPHPNLSIENAEYGGGVMLVDVHGQQIKMPGGGTSKAAYYFVKNFWVEEDSGGRYRGDPQIEISALYNGTTSAQFRDETYLTRDNILSGPVAAIYRTVTSGTSAEVLLSADYNQDGNAAELRVKEDSSGNLTYKIHRGSGVYENIGGGSTWIAFPI